VDSAFPAPSFVIPSLSEVERFNAAKAFIGFLSMRPEALAGDSEEIIDESPEEIKFSNTHSEMSPTTST